MNITTITTWECDYCRLTIEGNREEADIGWVEYVIDLPKGWHEIVIDPLLFSQHPCLNMMLVCENCFNVLSQQGKVIEDFWKRSEEE